jgi:hypothetical protein
MWIIIKFDNKRFSFLEEDLIKKFGKNFKIYIPKLSIQRIKNKKIMNKEFNLLGDYLFCFHEDFKNIATLNKLKFCRGLKYFLNGFLQSQIEIQKFISMCKKSENNFGYLSHTLQQLKKNSKYKFSSGPFTEKMFKIIDVQKNKIEIMLGNIKTTVGKQSFLLSKI